MRSARFPSSSSNEAAFFVVCIESWSDLFYIAVLFSLLIGKLHEESEIAFSIDFLVAERPIAMVDWMICAGFTRLHERCDFFNSSNINENGNVMVLGQSP